ncbi:MAG TPA: IS256 family transposase [Bryobacteraceae bacterium]|nr:IS256 family transposase [Bryobacteraceae bacterium]
MEIKPEVLDELLKGIKTQEDLAGPNGLLKAITKALVERMLEGEMTHHLGYEKSDPEGYGSGNSRNGKSRKKVRSEQGEIEIAVPRDRQGSFEPQVVRKHQTRWNGLDEKIIALYARGMTVRDIQAQLEEMYGVEVSPGLISEVTDAVLDEVKGWQNRPLDCMYPVLYLDALMVKMRHEGRVENRAVYVAIGINEEGGKEVLGLWSSANEGAKFWLAVMTELKNRGVRDVYIVCTDGLKGFPQAIEAVFPKAQIQTCIVHLIRASLNYVSWKERKAVAADLKPIYRAPTVEAAELALAEFREHWPKHQVVADVWQRNWALVIPFFQFPEEIRKVIYTTNAVESLHMSLRKVTKNRGSFPNEEAAMKLLYLALRNASRKWATVQFWKEAMRQFELVFPGRREAARAA